MTHLSRGALAVLVPSMLALSPPTMREAAAARAQDASADSRQCKQIHALIIDTSAPAGCASPFNFCAAGTIKGNHGLVGTTYFVLDGVAGPPATAPGFVTTTGTIVLTTPHGTLAARQTGVSKLTGRPSNGFLTEVQEITGGTGRFANASGLLYLNGTDVDSVFFSRVTGELCLPGGSPDR